MTIPPAYYSLLFFFILTIGNLSQIYGQKATLRGVAQDSLQQPLPHTNIIATPLAEEGYITFAISDQQGRYRLDLLEEVAYGLEITHLGFSKGIDTVRISQKTNKNFTLYESTESLEEVIIEQQMAVFVKEDTITSRVEQFKTGEERKLREVLKKLPGVEVDREGNLTGEDLGAYLRQEFPSTRIIILTMFSEKLRLINILQNVNPDGFLIKSDVTPQELQAAVQTVIKGQNYYSETIKKIIERQQTKHHVLDDYDRRILYHLSKGTKTRNLVEYVPLSLGAIEKRKRKIKEVFNITSGGDREILDKARELGFL